MAGIGRRLEALERLYREPSAEDEEGRRRVARERLDELAARLGRARGGAAGEDAGADEIRDFYRSAFGGHAGDEEYERRMALVEEFGAVSLAPPSQQRSLRRLDVP